ncbi:SDR family oxidoreductase [Chloroflexota bacterium]
MNKKLKDKVAIITGGASGIGRAVCLAFAKHGARVMIFDTASVEAETVISEIEEMSQLALFIQGDVRDRQRVDAMVRTTLDNFNKIDVVVNCAGIIRDMLMYKMTDKDWDDVIDICLKGTFTVTQAVINWMTPQAIKEQKEGKQPPARKIINVTSGAVRGNTGQANYCAAKAGIIGITRSNARELGRYNILVNAISPLSLTDMTQNIKEELTNRTILKRVGDPEKDIAPMFVFLASDDANYITGQVIGVNGGLDTQY